MMENESRHLEQIFQLIPSGLFTVDTAQRITSWNRRAEEVTGYTVEEVIGKKCTIFTEYPCREYCGVFSKKIKKPITNKECTIKRNDGHLRIVLKNADLIKDENRTIIGAIESFEDITERKKAEAVLKRDKATLEMLVNKKTKELLAAVEKFNKVKRLSDIGALTAIIAHELRNPLAAIRTAAYNIKRKVQNPSLDSHLQNIEKKVLEADQIIDNVLIYSRIKPPQFEKAKLYNLLDECIATAKIRFPDCRISIRKICKTPKECFVEADQLQLKEVFSNILNNAYESFKKKKGGITIRSWFDKQGHFNISFEDKGVGIMPEDLKRTTEPFFTTKKNGVGLGLAICDQIVNLHNGNMKIESKVGKGTTVTITLPVSR